MSYRQQEGNFFAALFLIYEIKNNTDLWGGILSGVVVIILGLTGCVLVFADEIRPLVYADRMEVPSVSGVQLSMQDMMQKAQDIWGSQ